MAAVVTGAAVAALAAAAPPVAAAATITPDRACYVSGQAGTLALQGFTPRATVTVASPELGATSVTTDGEGAAAVPLVPPAGTDLPRPGSREIAFTATEDGTPSITARATSRIAPLAFRAGSRTVSPASPRAWAFSGWTPEKSIYAHFRFRGRTVGSYRFGPATGPCGEYVGRAPGIAITGRVHRGTWTVVVDQSPIYRPATRPALATETVVFRTYRPPRAR